MTNKSYYLNRKNIGLLYFLLLFLFYTFPELQLISPPPAEGDHAPSDNALHTLTPFRGYVHIPPPNEAVC
jgi:hypothetical protein